MISSWIPSENKANIVCGFGCRSQFYPKRINIDTTVQEKEIRFLTDARLYDRARQHLVMALDETSYGNRTRDCHLKREHSMDRNWLKGVEGVQRARDRVEWFIESGSPIR